MESEPSSPSSIGGASGGSAPSSVAATAAAASASAFCTISAAGGQAGTVQLRVRPSASKVAGNSMRVDPLTKTTDASAESTSLACEV